MSATSPTFGETKTAATTTSLIPRAETQSLACVPVLGYWNIRGLAEPVRYLLKYKGVAFEDRRYNFGPAPGYDFGEWGNVKANLGLRYPGLPYYIDGDVKLTQSIAIMRYLGRKHSLVGRCEEDLQEVDLMEQQVCELRWGLGRVIFSLDFEASRKRYIQMLPMTLETYSIYFRVKRWILGDDISYVDFMMYETLDWIRVFHAEALTQFEALTDYCARFEALPGVGEYRTSAQFVSWPIFGPLAKWGFRERPQI
ncbi:hypothetical protein HPB47_007482 [Ixodes persulcatus]|uniref:Uncharacterized protein n=1 Tax=Ixodes persulcatus TaxID=34615 RepID=A0AC60P7H6_IXOPE|nr:hypothetical protein HPB47_007482 [Ixodes persulcatus]